MKKAISKYKRLLIFFSIFCCLVLGSYIFFRYFSYSPILKDARWGMALDSFNHVKVYYNGNISTTNGRNITTDGYNIGLKYKCVEFVKRYYYEHFNHKMPDSYGNAKDFFDLNIGDGIRNTKRDLIQYSNPSKAKPKIDDLLIFGGSAANVYGHVAIVCGVTDHDLTIIQQNPGTTAPSRVSLELEQSGGGWKIKNSRILGWLRKE